MAIVQSYDSAVFESLPNFRVAKRSLAKHKANLKELGAVICRHCLQEHVGVSLLHKHFHVSLDEQLVKEITGNQAYIKPHINPDTDKIVPYLWKFAWNQATEINGYYPLEFVDIFSRASEAKSDVEAVSSREEFLTEMAAKLCELELENIFGICALHSTDEIVLSEDETLLETTDHKNRVLTLSPMPKTQFDLVEITETNWRFIAITELEAVIDCQSHCVRHCNNHE